MMYRGLLIRFSSIQLPCNHGAGFPVIDLRHNISHWRSTRQDMIPRGGSLSGSCPKMPHNSCHCCSTRSGRHHYAQSRIAQSCQAHSTFRCCCIPRGRIPSAAWAVRVVLPAQVQPLQKPRTAASPRTSTWRSSRKVSGNQPSIASVLLHTLCQKIPSSGTAFKHPS